MICGLPATAAVASVLESDVINQYASMGKAKITAIIIRFFFIVFNLSFLYYHKPKEMNYYPHSGYIVVNSKFKTTDSKKYFYGFCISINKKERLYMFNTISQYRSPVFTSRYIDGRKLNNLPPKIREAVCKSDTVENFIAEGKPKNLLEWFIDLFKKGEELQIDYVLLDNEKIKNLSMEKGDIYHAVADVVFSLKKGADTVKRFTLPAIQNGIKRKPGSVPKPNEHYAYKPPTETVEDILAKKIGQIDDLNILLK